MRTVGAEGAPAGDLGGACGLVPSIHKPLYRHSYQLSIDICEVLASELERVGELVERKERHPNSSFRLRPRYLFALGGETVKRKAHHCWPRDGTFSVLSVSTSIVQFFVSQDL